METKAGALDRIRKFGGHMSGMVMPNLSGWAGDCWQHCSYRQGGFPMKN